MLCLQKYLCWALFHALTSIYITKATVRKGTCRHSLNSFFFFLIFHQKELFGECLHVSTIVLLNKDEHIADPLKTSNKCSLQTFGRGTFLLRIWQEGVAFFALMPMHLSKLFPQKLFMKTFCAVHLRLKCISEVQKHLQLPNENFF